MIQKFVHHASFRHVYQWQERKRESSKQILQLTPNRPTRTSSSSLRCKRHGTRSKPGIVTASANSKTVGTFLAVELRQLIQVVEHHWQEQVQLALQLVQLGVQFLDRGRSKSEIWAVRINAPAWVAIHVSWGFASDFVTATYTASFSSRRARNIPSFIYRTTRRWVGKFKFPYAATCNVDCLRQYDEDVSELVLKKIPNVFCSCLFAAFSHHCQFSFNNFAFLRLLCLIYSGPWKGHQCKRKVLGMVICPYTFMWLGLRDIVRPQWFRR